MTNSSSSRTAKLATFLAITIASSDAFAPSSGRVQHRQSQSQNVVLSATTQSNDDDHDGSWKKVAGGAAAFVTGLGFMAQVAFADPASIEFSNHGKHGFVFI